VEGRCSRNVRGIYIFNERKETAKVCETLIDAVQEGNKFLRKLSIEGKFSIQEFRQDDEK
jgi:hypothetical protein